MRIFLIRHGESMEGIDPPLSERGRLQSVKLAQKLNEFKISKVYVSSSRRTLETAQPFLESNPKIPVETNDDLKEIYRVIVGGRPKENTLPSREQDDRKRATSFFKRLDTLPDRADVAIIFHGNFIRYILGSIIGADLTKLWDHLDIDCGSISLIEKRGSTFSIGKINETAHLSEAVSVNRVEQD